MRRTTIIRHRRLNDHNPRSNHRDGEWIIALESRADTQIIMLVSIRHARRGEAVFDVWRQQWPLRAVSFAGAHHDPSKVMAAQSRALCGIAAFPLDPAGVMACQRGSNHPRA